LPADVAALVSSITADGICLTLVNLSAHASREVIIAAGSFGEHRFSVVTVDAGREDAGREDAGREDAGRGDDEGTTIQVDNTCITVDLRPGTEIELRLGMQHYCQKPSYAFPWHTDGVPVR